LKNYRPTKKINGGAGMQVNRNYAELRTQRGGRGHEPEEIEDAGKRCTQK